MLSTEDALRLGRLNTRRQRLSDRTIDFRSMPAREFQKLMAKILRIDELRTRLTSGDRWRVVATMPMKPSR